MTASRSLGCERRPAARLALLFVVAVAASVSGASGADGTTSRKAPEIPGARAIHAEPSPQQAAEAQRLQREAEDLRRRLAESRRTEATLLEEARRLDQEWALRRIEADAARAAASAEEAAANEAAARAASLGERVKGLRRRAGLVARALHLQGRDRSIIRMLLQGDEAGSDVGSVLVERQVALASESRLAELAARTALAESNRRASSARRLHAEAEAAVALASRQSRERQSSLQRIAEAARRDGSAAQEKEKAAAELLAALQPDAVAALSRTLAREAREARARPRPELRMNGLGDRRGRLPWPTEGNRRVLERWGPVRDPVRGTMTFRHGIAIEAGHGETIRAVADGRVAFVDWYKGFGRCLVLDHGGGDLSVLAHADVFTVEAGDLVAAGEEVGRVGDTGSLQGPRLWFQIQRSGESVNPLEWLTR